MFHACNKKFPISRTLGCLLPIPCILTCLTNSNFKTILGELKSLVLLKIMSHKKNKFYVGTGPHMWQSCISLYELHSNTPIVFFNNPVFKNHETQNSLKIKNYLRICSGSVLFNCFLKDIHIVVLPIFSMQMKSLISAWNLIAVVLSPLPVYFY